MAAGGLLRREPDDSLGTRAERHVFDRLRAALPPEYTMLSNIAWLVRDHGSSARARPTSSSPTRSSASWRSRSRPARSAATARAVVGGRRPARPIAVPAGGRQPPQPRGQAQGAPGLAGGARSDRRPRRRVPERRPCQPRREDPDGHRHRPGADPRQGAPGARPAAQSEAARVGRSLLRAVGHGVQRAPGRQGRRAPALDDDLAARASVAASVARSPTATARSCG